MPASLYSHVFATVYDPVMYWAEKRFLAERRQYLLQHAKGTVLEIGAGTGVNFPYYPENTKVFALEPSAPMMKKAQESMPEKADIQLLNAGIDDKMVLENISPESLDAIVCTLVLCTVPNLNNALERCLHLLKPGGKMLVFEHIKARSNKWAKVQQAATPLWKVLAEGCHLNRATDALLLDYGFQVKEERRYKKLLDWYEAILVNP